MRGRARRCTGAERARVSRRRARRTLLRRPLLCGRLGRAGRLADAAFRRATAGRALTLRRRAAARLIGIAPVLAAELLLHRRVSVAPAAAVRRIVLPVVADVVDVHRPVGDDVSAAPVDAATPIIAAAETSS